MYHPDEHFMAVGREQIRDWAIGIEMDGLDGWHYDYVCTMIDETKALVLGFWKQRAGFIDDNTGKEFEKLGLGVAKSDLKRVTGVDDNSFVKTNRQRVSVDTLSTVQSIM